MDTNELNNDLKIDLNALHTEWIKQPSLYMKYSSLAAKAQGERDRAKERIDVIRAECDNDIREHLVSYNCPEDKSGNYKPTEAWISSTIQRQEKFQKVNEEFHSANYVLNLLQGAVRAFDHRKKALEMEVQLWQGNYYSSPVDKSGQVVSVAAEKVADKQRDTLRRRSQGG